MLRSKFVQYQPRKISSANPISQINMTQSRPHSVSSLNKRRDLSENPISRPLVIPYYFDYKSPFSYLSFDLICDLEKDFDVLIQFLPHPFNVGQSFGLVESRTSYHWNKLKYGYLDARRFANERGSRLSPLPLSLPLSPSLSLSSPQHHDKIIMID